MALPLIQPRFQFIYNDIAAAGYKVFTYIAGTSTKKTTWTDQTKAVVNTNPIILDSQGMADIWLDGSYKIVIATPTAADPPLGGEIIYTVDNVIGFDLIDWSGLTASIADVNSTNTAILSKSLDYTVAIGNRNKTILVDATGGDVTISLLAAATALNTFNITIKKIDLSTNKVIIDPNGVETVDSQTTYHLYDFNDFIETHSDASNWKLTSSQIRGTVRTITAVETLGLDDNTKVINCNASGGAFLVNLPANSTVGRGYRITIKKIDSTTNPITITPAGGELIDGNANILEKKQYGASSLITTGTGWSIYSEFGVDVKTRLPKNFMDGMLIANGTDTVNDIDFQAGTCRDSTDSDNLTLGATVVKQMDANWVAGTNSGGRPVGVPYANDTWYHCFVIAKPDGTTDAGFDTAINASNLLAAATGYTLFRRTGAVRSTITPAAIGIIQFKAWELGGYVRQFTWNAVVGADINLASASSTTTLSLSFVPPNVIVNAILSLKLDTVSGGGFSSWRLYPTSTTPGNTAIGSMIGVGENGFQNEAGSLVNIMTDGAATPLIGYIWTSNVANHIRIAATIGWQEFARSF